MTPMTQINVKFNPIVKTIPTGFDRTTTYQVVAIDRIEEGDDLVTEFLLVDADNKFQWVEADMMIHTQMIHAQAQETKSVTKPNNSSFGFGHGRQQQQQRGRSY